MSNASYQDQLDSNLLLQRMAHLHSPNRSTFLSHSNKEQMLFLKLYEHKLEIMPYSEWVFFLEIKQN